MSTSAIAERAAALQATVAGMAATSIERLSAAATRSTRALDFAVAELEALTGVSAEEWRSRLLARAAVMARGEIATTRAA